MCCLTRKDTSSSVISGSASIRRSDRLSAISCRIRSRIFALTTRATLLTRRPSTRREDSLRSPQSVHLTTLRLKCSGRMDMWRQWTGGLLALFSLKCWWAILPSSQMILLLRARRSYTGVKHSSSLLRLIYRQLLLTSSRSWSVTTSTDSGRMEYLKSSYILSSKELTGRISALTSRLIFLSWRATLTPNTSIISMRRNPSTRQLRNSADRCILRR